MKPSICLFLPCASIILAGCSATTLFTPNKLNLETEDSNRRTRDIEFYGPDTMIARERIEPVNLLFMLDPKGRARTLNAESRPGAKDNWSELTLDEKYEWGFHAFYDAVNASSGSTIEQRRNRIQDRLLITSDQRCGLYKRVIYQVQADSKFWTGSLATVSGVLGSLFGGQAARNLAGTSGILSGVGAEFSQAYYSNLAANVITKGIEERRKSIFARIAAAQKVTISDYTVQAAVKDAVFYDMQCSVVAGLEEAQDAIRLAAEPGMDAANRIMAKQKVTAELVKADKVEHVKKLSEDYAALQSTSLLGGDRFSNVGVSTLITTSAPPLVVEPEFFASLAFDPATEANGLRTQLKDIFAKVATPTAGALGLDDAKDPPTPIAAAKELFDLKSAFTAKVNACTSKWMPAYGDKLGAAAKETVRTVRDQKFKEVSAAIQQMESAQQTLRVVRGRITDLQARLLGLPAASLFDGSLDGSDKAKPIKLRSLKEIDALIEKSTFDPDATEIKARISMLCG